MQIQSNYLLIQSIASLGDQTDNAQYTTKQQGDD